MASSAVDFIRRHKRPLTGTLVGILVAVVALTAPRLVFATFQDTLLGILSGITYWLISLLANLLVVIINIMVAAAQYSKFLGVDAVEKGWAIVRDVSNMFFIVVLLIIAFGTILRLENYRYNRLLARLIVMAVLVNFSKFIAGFFIDFAQVVMLTFVNAWRDVAAGNFTQALGLSDIIALSNNQQSLSVDVNSGAVFTALVLGLAVVLIAVIVMVIIAIVLIIRILALWFLIVLSPLAYLLRTYPSTEKYAARWWQEFGKYTVTGPVVAFLLWLTLAIMSGPVNLSHEILATKTTTGETTSLIQGDTGGSEPAERISATISAIGQSDKLLSYMIGIMLLVGTLVITKELGVAGGQLAGQAASRIQGFATKAATLAGVGIATGGVLTPAAVAARKPILTTTKTVGKVVGKGIGGAALDWAERRTGAVLRPKEWIEGFQRGAKRRRDRSRETVYRKALDRWRGTTKEVTEKKWEFGKKRALGFIPLPSREVQFDKSGKPITRTKQEWHPIRAMAAMPEFARVNFLTPEGLLAAAGGRFRKYREATNQQQLGQKELDQLLGNLEGARVLERPEHFAIEHHAREGMLGEMERRRLAGETIANLRTKKNEKDEEVVEDIDNAMRAEGIDVLANPATDAKKREFLRRWDEERIDEMSDEDYQKMHDEAAEKYRTSTNEEARVKEGQRLLAEDAEKKRKEAAQYTGPNARLTEEKKEEKNKQLEELRKQLAKIDEDIRKKEAAGADTKDLLTRRDEMEKNAKNLSRYIVAGIAASDEDKAASEEKSKGLTKEADRLDESARRSITDTDLRIMEERAAKQSEQVRLQGEEVSKYRMPTPFELHNEFRAAVNEKGKQLLTDDWHEHLAVMEDAIRQGDATLAAAAFKRAAEYANENELANAMGYDYSKGDFRAFIEDIFRKKLHLSEDQALGIASDISFTAEKNRHYNIMRSTSVDPATGHRMWQTEDDQTAEIVAEMKKMDTEDVTRRTNRLGYMDEIVGLNAGLERFRPKEGASDAEWQAFREKKARFFRSGGSREALLAPNGISFMAGKFHAGMRNIEQSRYNDSTAEKLTDPANAPRMRILEDTAGAEKRVRTDKSEKKDGDEAYITVKQWEVAIRALAAANQREKGIDFTKEAIRRVKLAKA